MKTVTNKYYTDQDGDTVIAWPTSDEGFSIAPQYRNGTFEGSFQDMPRHGNSVRAGYSVTQLDSDGYPVSQTKFCKTLVDVLHYIAA